MRTYVVRQGDHLEALAVRLAFDAKAVWNDPKNAELKKLRKDPAILCPGDVLYLPEPTRESSPVQSGGSNSYKAKIPMVPIHFVIKGPDNKPMAGEKYVVEGAGAPIEGTTDGSGAVSVQVPAITPSCRVVLTDKQASYVLKIGHLDPIDEESGVRQRLEHLGFMSSPFERWRRRPLSLEKGVRDYQNARGLSPTGTIDDATRAALENEHGA
jgi:hypothetical protein